MDIKRIISIAISALSLAALQSCDSFKAEYLPDYDLSRYAWTVSDAEVPDYMPEIGMLEYRSPEQHLKATLQFRNSDVRLAFPGGGYRTVNFQTDPETGIITFSGVLFYGETSGDDVTVCRYQVKKILGMHYLTLYEGRNPSRIDPDRGEWSVTFLEERSKTYERGTVPIDGPYGTFTTPVDYGLQSGTLWSPEPVCGNCVFSQSREDLASAYWGPAWALPNITEADEMINACNMQLMNALGSKLIVLTFPGATLSMALPAPERPDVQYGIWLDNGSALVYTYDNRDKITTGITDRTLGQMYYVLPVYIGPDLH